MNYLNLLKQHNPELNDKLKDANISIDKSEDVYVVRNKNTNKIEDLYHMTSDEETAYRLKGSDDVDLYHRFVKWFKCVLNIK